MNRGVPAAGNSDRLEANIPQSKFSALERIVGSGISTRRWPDVRANSSTFRILKTSVQSFFPEEVLWPQGASRYYININDNNKAAYLNDYLKTENKN